MFSKISQFFEITFEISFISLALLTPLIFTTKNTELFEVPKMHFVYVLTLVILFATVARVIVASSLQRTRNDLAGSNRKVRTSFSNYLFRSFIANHWSLVPPIAFFIFVVINLISTATALDKFTAVFGYPSRLNGGLISQIAFLIIFATALLNFTPQLAKKVLTAIVISATAVALWGIPGHFGIDPSCQVITGELTSDCWQKEFNPRLRIFSTLGQPNWLAQFLVLVIPLSLAFALNAKKFQKPLYLLASAALFLALIFTTSRAGFLGLVASLIFFFAILGGRFYKKNLKYILLTIPIFIILAYFSAPPLLARLNEFVEAPQPQRAQTAGTESGQLRLIVWKGALEALKAKPIFGHGPENFAYSYYLFRSPEHNQTTEWNFFYNKAHNEFLNYAANLGITGLIAYLVFLTSTLYLLTKGNKDDSNPLIGKAAVAGIIGYHVAIFFGFSTVASQTAMFLLIPAALSLIKATGFNPVRFAGLNPVLITPTKIFLLTLTALGFLILLSFPVRSYFADNLLQRAKNRSSLSLYQDAVETFPAKNPFYLSDYAQETAFYAKNGENLAFAQKAGILTQAAISLAPNNLITQRRVVTTYILIADFDHSYLEKAVKEAQKLINLAPSDPQSYLSLAKAYVAAGKVDDAKKSVERALEMKPDYVEAKELLQQVNERIVSRDRK